MPITPKHAFKEKSIKLLILLPLRTIYNRTFQCETPCITADAIHAILIHLKLSLEELDVNGPNMDGYFQYIRHSQMDRDKDMLSTMKNLKVFNCTSLKKDFVAQLKQKHPGLSINQKDLKIATPEQSLNPDFGFWDIEAAKVSYLGPESGLCEASGKMICFVTPQCQESVPAWISSIWFRYKM